MLSLISPEPTRTLSGLGLIQNRMTTSLGMPYAKPTLVGAGSTGVTLVGEGEDGMPTLVGGAQGSGIGEYDLPTIDFGLGADGSPVVASAVFGVLSLGVSIGGIAYGAHRGAQRSPGWAAGGALIGAAAAGLVNLVLAAAIGAMVTS